MHCCGRPTLPILVLALCGLYYSWPCVAHNVVGPVWLAVLVARSSLNCVDPVWYTISLGGHGSSVIGPDYMGNSVVN